MITLSHTRKVTHYLVGLIWRHPWAEPGFLERGFICIKVWGFALLNLSHFSDISHENEIIWSQ